MKIYFCLLVCLLSLNGMAQFGGGNGSGYTRGNGGGVGQCYTMATIAVHACDNYALPSGSQVVNTPGTYNDTIPNFSGCDSLLTIQLTLSYSSSGNLTLSGCDSLTVNGSTYTSSGTYLQFLTNAAGCDSVLTLQLGIQQSSSGSLTASACNSFTFHGQTYASSGNYTQTIVNSAGCDSVVNLSLTITPLSNQVIQNGNTLTADQFGATYQWLDCNNGFSPISGQTAQAFSPTANGNYAVALTLGNCTDTSACIPVVVNALEGSALAYQVTCHPNPTRGDVRLEMNAVADAVEVVVFDLAGKEIQHQSAVQTDHLQFRIDGPAGTYLLRIRLNAAETRYFRILKQ